MNQWKPYLIALAVGLLVGIERENSKSEQKALGVRTFLLLSLLGAVSGGLQSPWQSALITGFSLSLILVSYFLQRYSENGEVHLGLTTEFAAGIVYFAGYLTHSSPALAAIIGPIVAIILFSKLTLHRFIHAIKADELKAAISILLITAVVIEFAPDTSVDPWGFFNPRKFGYLVLTLACFEFLSYISYKFVGEKKSSLVVGLLGGFVSSTVVLISSAKQAETAAAPLRSLAITATAAQLASLVELLLIVSLVSPILFIQVSYSAVPLIIFAAFSVFILNRKLLEQSPNIDLKSPLEWKGVFRLSVVFTFLLAMISIVEHWFGTQATLTLSFLTGLFELQGVSLANATLFVQNQVSIQTATECISVAIVASLLSKLAISWFFARNKFSIYMTMVFVPMIGLVILITNWIL